MNKKYKLLLIALMLLSLRGAAQQGRSGPPPLSCVDPYIGSAAHGHVFVGASVPFGAVQPGPDNINRGWDWCSGYHYSDSVLKGFSQDHLNGTGIPDLGDILITPYVDARISYYRHKDEVVKPACYSVRKSDGVKVQLTATERVSFHRYTFPVHAEAHILIDLREGNYAGWMRTDKIRGYLEKAGSHILKGWRNSSGWASDRRIYFAIESSVPVGNLVLFDSTAEHAGDALESASVKGLLTFRSDGRPVLLKVGISPVSSDEALANIRAELPGWDFQAVVKAGEDKWSKALSLVEVQTKDDAFRRVFYTALYHTMITPALYNDHDGSYRGTDKKVYVRPGFNNYTIFSLWDTYRALHPLMTVIQPARSADFVNSMLAIYQQQGKLPIWHLQGNETNCMVGYSAVPVIADACLKGIGGIDTALAFQAMKASSVRDDYGMKYIKKMGWIPADKEIESVSKAMEYAIDDWCIAQLAKKLHRDEDYKNYGARALAWRRYFDTTTKFVRGVMSDGSWRAPFHPAAFERRAHDFTEGVSWQYTWLVPQDVEGLIRLMGGDEAFGAKLDSLFVVKESMGKDAPDDISGLIGLYAHGNEPNHHIPYLYAFAGQQWKTAEKVRQIMAEMYTDKPDGLCGNDDCGQMSAWYVLSALGFYPVNPANGIFVLGSPLVDKAVIHSGKKAFTIQATHNSKANKYIQRATLNGKDYTKSYIRYGDIVRGGILRLEMGPVPNKQFGSAPGDRPPTQINL
ncbi:MAG TPA: GH92 family glycosyl hydrolase [Puia sp.]